MLRVDKTQEAPMMNRRAVTLAAFALVLGAPPLVAQAPFQYREFALASSVATIVRLSGARTSDTRTTYERPAKIQELVWRAPYVKSRSDTDPVDRILFRFLEDQLYQVVVTYDRERIEGLTNDDLVQSISATYGVPVLKYAKTDQDPQRLEGYQDATIVMQWEDAAGQLTLTRGTSSPRVQLTLTSKELRPRADAAIAEAVRLDALEAPQRELERRQKQADDAQKASQDARETNKVSFRP
jgi:hypothetical protein